MINRDLARRRLLAILVALACGPRRPADTEADFKPYVETIADTTGHF